MSICVNLLYFDKFFKMTQNHLCDNNRENNLLYEDLTYKVIGCCFEVYNVLGKGFSEVIYKDALEHELKQNKIPFKRETGFVIEYKDIILDRLYICDFIVDERVILEVKAQENVISKNSQQLINYLAVTKCRVGLLINFGESSLKYKRFIL